VGETEPEFTHEDKPLPVIALLGLWHLGSVSAAGWTRLGYRVRAWDPDAGLRDAMRHARPPVVETGVDDQLAAGVASGTLEVVDHAASAVGAASVTHLCFDTHVDSRNRVDDPRLDGAVDEFVRSAPVGALLLVSSQVPVGTCRRWQDVLDRSGRGLMLAHVPENLRLGQALDDFIHPPRLVIGADDDEAFRSAAALFASIQVEPIRVRPASAEMTKHATNAYLALCIAFANDLAWLSLEAGGDPDEVAAGLRADPRVAPTAPLRPGTAFSGATLSRDLEVLRALGAASGRSDLFDAVVRSNERHARLPIAWLEAELETLGGRHIAVAGLTYKPGTSTVRDSLPLRVVAEVVERGAHVTAWDPSAEDVTHPPLRRAPSLSACVEGSDALVVLTALPELARVDWAGLRPKQAVVIDATGVVDRGAAERGGWAYRGLSGVSSSKP
jgi:UDPglucose 6-dehydrogenase